MRKRQHHSRQVMNAQKPSDAVSVVAIAATAGILVLSLFAMERFAGVPVSVRGEAMYPQQQSVRSSKVSPARRSGGAAARRAARQARTGNATTQPAAAAATRCSDAQCSNLVSTFLSGAPDCMRYQQCVDTVYATIAAPSCPSYGSCRTLAAIYAFYYTNRSCVYDMTATCSSSVEAAKKAIR